MAKPNNPYSKPFREAEKELYKALKPYGKEHGYKKIECYLWKKQGEFLICSDYFLSMMERGIEVNGWVKSLDEDNILWEILGMEGNKEQPLSLRVRGAFVNGGMSLKLEKTRKNTTIPIESDDKLEVPAETAVRCVDEAASSYLDSIDYDLKKHYKSIIATDAPLKTEPFTLNRLIAEVGLGNYQKAYDLAESACGKKINILHFGIGDKGDLELVMEYCERKLAEQKRG